MHLYRIKIPTRRCRCSFMPACPLYSDLFFFLCKTAHGTSPIFSISSEHFILLFSRSPKTTLGRASSIIGQLVFTLPMLLLARGFSLFSSSFFFREWHLQTLPRNLYSPPPHNFFCLLHFSFKVRFARVSRFTCFIFPPRVPVSSRWLEIRLLAELNFGVIHTFQEKLSFSVNQVFSPFPPALIHFSLPIYVFFG